MDSSTLDGVWLVAADSENVGIVREWFRGAPRSEAQLTIVPGTIENTLPLHGGVIWYWREFTTAPAGHGRTLLRFMAVEYLTDVWINERHVGRHEGGNTPFEFDITDELAAGQNKLVARVLHPGKHTIDGLELGAIPHGLRGLDASLPNWGGIWQSVELRQGPNVSIADVFAQPDWSNGAVTCHITLANAAQRFRQPGGDAASLTVEQSDVPGRFVVTVWEDRGGRAVGGAEIESTASIGLSEHCVHVSIRRPHSWSPADPFLYRLHVSWSSEQSRDETSVRFGLREFTYADGYFHLNGRRFFPRSAHTIGVYPGGMQPSDPDLLRRELLVAKEAGFNMLRILGNCAIPPQLDMADELGLLIYQEHSASWAIDDTHATAARHQRELEAVIRRDRNHPSVVIWGVLNEILIFVPDGPVAANAIAMLPNIRRIDPTRFVVLDSGRFNYARWHEAMFLTKPGVGNFALPYSSVWIDDIADVHTYGEYPTSKLYRETLRNPPVGGRKVFQTEFGHNTCLDLEQGLRKFERAGISEDNPEVAVWREVTQRFLGDWESLRMGDVFPTPRHLWDADREAHSQKIRSTWSLAQANPNQIGTNYTAFCDEMMNAEGVVDYFRDAKPAVSTIRRMQEPLLWCLFATPASANLGSPIEVEVLLRNEDVLPPGTYPAEILLYGPAGLAWSKKFDVVIPTVTADGPVVHPVFAETVLISGPDESSSPSPSPKRIGDSELAGDYELHVRLLAGADARMSMPLFIGSTTGLPIVSGVVSTLGRADSCRLFLAAQGLTLASFDIKRTDVPLIIHCIWDTPEGPDILLQALSFAEAGGTVLLLEVTGTEYPRSERLESAQQAQQQILQMLPGMIEANLVWDTRNWFTGTTHYMRPHSAFEGLPTRCVMEGRPVYEAIYAMHSVAGAVGWDEITGAFSTGALPFGGTEHDGVPPYFHYWHAMDLAERRHGSGKLIYCAYQLLENVDRPGGGQKFC